MKGLHGPVRGFGHQFTAHRTTRGVLALLLGVAYAMSPLWRSLNVEFDAAVQPPPELGYGSAHAAEAYGGFPGGGLLLARASYFLLHLPELVLHRYTVAAVRADTCGE